MVTTPTPNLPDDDNGIRDMRDQLKCCDSHVKSHALSAGTVASGFGDVKEIVFKVQPQHDTNS